MKPIDFIELKIPAKAEYIGVVRLMLSGLSSRFGFSIDDTEDIKLAVAEACTNAVTHAYQEEEGQILIGCATYEDRIEIMVIDHGQSFDLDEIKSKLGPIDRNATIEELNEGGLGLFLIESLMDKVEITSESGVIIVMTKYIRSDEVERNDQPISSAT